MNYFYKILKKFYYLITSRNFHKRKYDEIIFMNGISAISASRAQYKNYKQLHEAEIKVFSQFGEDGIIDFILHNLNLIKPSFVEIGVEDYSESNTRFLYQRTSTKGLIIDSNKNLKKDVRNVLGDYSFKGELSVLSAFVDVENIIQILNETDNNNWFNSDIFSIDIDGIDYWILKHILPHLKSKLLIIEYNPVFGGEKEVTVPYDKKFFRSNYHNSNLFWGASLMAFYNLLEKYNYSFIGSNLNNHNSFWVKDDYLINSNFENITKNQLESFTKSYASESLEKTFTKDKLNTIANCSLFDLSDNSVKLLSTIFEL